MKFFDMDQSTGKVSNWLLGFALACLIYSCGEKQDDQKAILAIWRLASINVNGQEIGDGKGYLHFKENGQVASRTGPGIYEDGKYVLNVEKKKLTMMQDSSQLNYQYELMGDSLTMRTHENGMALLLIGKKVDQLPIKREDDLPPIDMPN